MFCGNFHVSTKGQLGPYYSPHSGSPLGNPSLFLCSLLAHPLPHSTTITGASVLLRW